ncbi:formylglycine-generating enzyme family protein [Reichenbachiella ulvae]|uniref:Formylglycine-generating enzyme family protein n=1 Tax=Reichenbachiella ulvae TaxID=2980104 RepID=A0ABT3CPI4_9BACT|nr:formylglycine-generating enzyme family protein [Reichenbachiella ulvae]MCV9385615.1 formylglycine-generating enzyme family protein [Reichenbachiella ulvae]
MSKKTNENKSSFWDNFHWTPPGKPIPPGENDDPLQDYMRREYNKKYTMNGINLKVILLFLSPIFLLFVYWGITSYFNNQEEENLKWSNWARRNMSFLMDAPEKISEDALTQVIGNLVDISAGSFDMGVDSLKIKRYTHSPKIRVDVPGFKIMEAEVTFDQWAACVQAGGCLAMPDDNNWGQGQRPVINVTYHEIQEQFIPWLYETTGYQFSLPSEAQWEYAATVGGQTLYVTGDTLTCEEANWGHYGNHRSHYGPYCGSAKENQKTTEVKSYAPNAWGLYDMVGNVQEICQDDHFDDYTKTPGDGTPLDLNLGNMGAKVIRGASYQHTFVDAANNVREYILLNKGSERVGFRLVLNEPEGN